MALFIFSPRPAIISLSTEQTDWPLVDTIGTGLNLDWVLSGLWIVHNVFVKNCLGGNYESVYLLHVCEVN